MSEPSGLAVCGPVLGLCCSAHFTGTVPVSQTRKPSLWQGSCQGCAASAELGGPCPSACQAGSLSLGPLQGAPDDCASSPSRAGVAGTACTPPHTLTGVDYVLHQTVTWRLGHGVFRRGRGRGRSLAPCAMCYICFVCWRTLAPLDRLVWDLHRAHGAHL